MKKIIAIAVSILFILSVTALSFAAEQKAAPAPAEKKMEKKEAAPAEKKAAPKVKQVTGEVKAADAKSITIAKKVKDKVEETVIMIDDKTEVKVGKEKKAIADVKAGDKATVKYTEMDGKNVAKSVVATAAPAKKEAAPAKTEKKMEKKEAAPAKKEAAPAAAPKAEEKKPAAAPEKKKTGGY